MFPVGDLLKTQVKQIAQDIGLSRIYSRREVCLLYGFIFQLFSLFAQYF